LHFMLAGDGPLRGSVDRFCRKPAGRMCRALGFVDDVPGLLSAADLFVLPSRWEGWPLALGEAMAAGLAAVGTDCSGIRDVLVPNETGLLVAPKDPVALAGAILMLADDPANRAKLAAAGRDRIHQHFTIQQFIARHEMLYDSLTG
ncbi:MAG: glycosyltransferase, partial [Planctomycetota bacterium]